MAEIDNSLDPVPCSKAELVQWISGLIKTKKLGYSSDYNSGTKERRCIYEIYELSGERFDDIHRVVCRAVEGRKNLNYIKAAFSKHSAPDPGSNEEPPREIPDTKNTPKKTSDLSAEESDDRCGKNYILLYRALRNHPYFIEREPILRLVFIDLILDAAWSDHEVTFRGGKIFLKRGQWATTFRKMAAEYKIPESSLRRWLKDMQDNEMLLFKIVSVKDVFNGAPTGAPAGAPAGARHDILGILVTICNYDKWQPNGAVKIDFNGAPTGAPAGAPRGDCTNKGITEEGITEEVKIVKFSSPLVIGELYELWEKGRGNLPAIKVREPEKIENLVVEINKLEGDPRANATEIIRLMSGVHLEHYSKMRLVYFSKNPGMINKLFDGDYNKSWDRGNNGKPKKIERAGTGSNQGFGGQATTAEERFDMYSELENSKV